jgi:hypothetical protein
MKLDYIATSGTGHCGTKYVAKLLTSIGIPCGHEYIITRDGRNWTPRPQGASTGRIKADSSHLLRLYVNQPLFIDVPVIHIIRDPLATISSLGVGQNLHKLDQAERNSRIKALAQVWLNNNETLTRWCTGRAAGYYIYMIDDGPEPLLELIGYEGLDLNNVADDRKANTHSPSYIVTPQDLDLDLYESLYRYYYEAKASSLTATFSLEDLAAVEVPKAVPPPPPPPPPPTPPPPPPPPPLEPPPAFFKGVWEGPDGLYYCAGPHHKTRKLTEEEAAQWRRYTAD